ncbi:hypothetical protein IAU60_004883 [Kwoniella sp. DSM 27419]
MSDPPTPLSLPTSLPFPITITRLLVQPGAAVRRGTHLLEYSFMSRQQREAIERRAKEGRRADVNRGEVEGDDGSGTWDCLVDGEVVAWEQAARLGTRIERRQASQPLLTVAQPCSHPVQLHGMCGICGADLTEDDYLSAPPPAGSSSQAGPSRHPGGFEITHDAMGVTVSKQEAQRLDNLTRDALLASRRLSLIVDLDQTIIHTTVDPTVAEWMEEIEADRRAEKSDDGKTTTPPVSPGPQPVDSTTPPHSPYAASKPLPDIAPPRPREVNPNAEALKDVARFQIADDVPPGQVKPQKRGVKDSVVQMQGRWYYTKPRPGLQQFLDDMSELYEMHVYTMGTRTYADAICKVIDPEGKIFGGRILSRDESGSFSSKNLKRLFPTDTSMVVVIDDRSDVWADCPNLVKVVPYDFFIGIGDINSSFLPKNKSPPAPSSASSAATVPSSATVDPVLDSPSTTMSTTSDLSTPPPTTPSDEPSVEDGLLLKTKLLDELSESRPLAKMQQELEGGGEVATGEEESGVDRDPLELGDTLTAKLQQASSLDGDRVAERSTTPPQSPPKARKPLLNPNDYELDRVQGILREVHERFYSAFDELDSWDPKTSLPMSCDVEFIIPELKARVLDGCQLVFSGLIPQMVPPERTDIWQTAETFGALCSSSVSPKITHCVTATLNTEKTYLTSRVPGAKVVWASWFWDSVALWQKQPEIKYLARNDRVEARDQEEAPSTRPTTPAVIESADPNDEDMDDDEAVGFGWDEGADKEWEDFMAEEDDDVTDTESVRSAGSAPSTPSKKRVRYADEESLPLEDFKDPSPTHPDDPPAKKRKPLLLEAPDGDEVPPENRFQYVPRGAFKGKGKEEDGGSGEDVVSGLHTIGPGDDEGDQTASEAEAGGEGHSEGGDDDEFAMMLMDSLAGDEEARDEE